ncbi:MAG: hypothetical protein J6X58_00400 [Bacteroidales bacterium]|nr:hypothetical protein [Bacteroidales bacterium]
MRIYKPKPTPKYKPTPKEEVASSPIIVYRDADDVMMELTVKIRKDLNHSTPFEWPDDFYHSLCTSWYEEQKKRSIKDIAFLCGEEAKKAMKKPYDFCIVCWYLCDDAACFIPTQEYKDGKTIPVLKQEKLSQRYYNKPFFLDNATAFKDALKAIAAFSPFDGWTKIFQKGLSIMQSDNVEYSGQEDVFDIPKPYFKYLLAAKSTQLGAGMGSWFDLPISGSKEFKSVSDNLIVEQGKALMYAINNC